MQLKINFGRKRPLWNDRDIKKVIQILRPKGIFSNKFLSDDLIEEAIKVSPHFTKDIVLKIRQNSFQSTRRKCAKRLRGKAFSNQVMKDLKEINFDLEKVSRQTDIDPLILFRHSLRQLNVPLSMEKIIINTKNRTIKPVKVDQKYWDLANLAISLDDSVEREIFYSKQAVAFEKTVEITLNEVFASVISEKTFSILHESKIRNIYDQERRFLLENTEQSELGYFISLSWGSKPTKSKHSEKGEKVIKQKYYSFSGDLEKKLQSITPDFYVDSHNKTGLRLYNKRIAWFECKDFMGGVSDMLDRKIFLQCEKYVKVLGAGCIIFSDGFSDHFMQRLRENKKLRGKVFCLDFQWFQEATLKKVPLWKKQKQEFF
eukprot:maker-scaffold_6-snap-gene-16.18-mRNA-1 protein AED:0.00 eAED:0.00 QI:46/1/1/1/1/1/3/72/372